LFCIAISLRLIYFFVKNQLTTSNIILTALIGISVLLVFYLAKLISNDRSAALFSATIVALVHFDNSIVAGEELLFALSSMIFIILTLIYFIKYAKSKNYLWIVFAIAAAAIHFSAIILISTLVIYFILKVAEEIPIEQNEIVFSALLIAFIPLVSLIRGVPIETLSASLTLDGLTSIVGLYPIYFGVIGAYFGMVAKNSRSLLISGLAGATIFLALIEGLYFMNYLIISLAVLSSLVIVELRKNITKTNFSRYEPFAIMFPFMVVAAAAIASWLI